MNEIPIAQQLAIQTAVEVRDLLVREASKGGAIRDTYLEELAIEAVKDLPVVWAPQSQYGLPQAVCLSNISKGIIAHGKAEDSMLEEGTILNIDVSLGYEHEGEIYYADTARTVEIGNIGFINPARLIFDDMVHTIRAGMKAWEVGLMIEMSAKSMGLNPVLDILSHGIGKGLHQPPHIPNNAEAFYNEELKEGDVICLEPMVTSGERTSIILDPVRGWLGEVKAITGKRCYQHEDMILIHEDKPPTILTTELYKRS